MKDNERDKNEYKDLIKIYEDYKKIKKNNLIILLN